VTSGRPGPRAAEAYDPDGHGAVPTVLPALRPLHSLRPDRRAHERNAPAVRAAEGAEPATGAAADLDMPRMACVEVVALLTINDE